jgi:FAD/FMN-containing dehydrogenase
MFTLQVVGGFAQRRNQQMQVIGMSIVAALAASITLVVFISIKRRENRCLVCTKSNETDFCTARHSHKVSRIAKQLKERKSAKPVSLKKKAVSHQVPKPGDKRYTDDKIDISDLNEIIDIDPELMICTAEPGVTFDDLVRVTMRYGLVPIIVPELKTITIGGAISGCSIESMSFKHGGFHDTCLEYEIITGKGDILTCTPDNENQLIFQMIHGSFGTLGILSKLKFRLIPAKPYVKMTYEKYDNLDDYKAAIWRHFKNKDVDFMDGIIHSPKEYVLSTGDFVDEAPYTNSYDWKKVYYRSTKKRKEDYIKTPDYFFRYDKGVTSIHPKTAVGRFFLGKFVGSAEVLRFAEKFSWLLSADKPNVNVDVFIPFSKFEEFIDWYKNEFRHFPLWCVPYKRVRDYEWISENIFNGLVDELLVDLAIYGMKQHGGKNYYKIMEDKLMELCGIKTLISYNYYTEKDFWNIWNKKNYFAVKEITDPNNIFRDLYTKTCKAARGLETTSTE